MEQSKKLIDRIKNDHIKPTPKWYFISKNALIWLAFIISVLIGAGAFSVILYAIQQTDFNLLSHFGHSTLEMLLGLLPLIWIIALIVFLVSAIYFIQNSKKGYKLLWSKLVGFSTGLSILIGTLFFISGGGRWLDDAFANRITLYESIQSKKKKMWMNPEAGYLSGTIQAVKENEFTLIDFNKKTWTVRYGKDVFIAPIINIEKNQEVKMMGKVISDGLFHAEDIMPWGGMKHRQKMKNRRKKR